MSRDLICQLLVDFLTAVLSQQQHTTSPPCPTANPPPTHHLHTPTTTQTPQNTPERFKTPPTPQIAIQAPQKPPERPCHLPKALATSRMTQPPPEHLPNALALPKCPQNTPEHLKTPPAPHIAIRAPQKPPERPRHLPNDPTAT
ncbi:hypothetical protein HYDPIDRAFT_31940 [Hydnomerulius pinastri MD-312]|uniref:Uncharacterized protein n=1 Tax=Hydnomerulius pinastri MD-312 TaxID=994086 RepID=A0A0C9VSA0_9AGAM|nr:hypothetical protein HYDPIDRAFT_31940 [Hydnomerulius pinastri MD-312]